MDYGLAPWLDAIVFSSAVIEAYDFPNGYLRELVHLDWLHSIEWKTFFCILMHSLGPPCISTSPGGFDCPQFRMALRTRASLFRYKLTLLFRGLSRAWAPSFDLWTIWVSPEVVVVDYLCRLSLSVDAWHWTVNVHLDVTICDEPRLPEDHRTWKTFEGQFW